MGRPTNVSPKAYLRSLLGLAPRLLTSLTSCLSYTLPFDRHDWVINSNGKEVRYVIDFYTGNENSPLSPPQPSQPGSPAVVPARPQGEKAHIAMHLDVRPALDSPGALFWRLKFSAFKLFQKYSSFLPFSLPSASPKVPPGGKGEEKKE